MVNGAREHEARFSIPILIQETDQRVSGWGVAQYPWLLVDEVTIVDAAGASATLWGLLVAVGLAVVVVVPPLAYLLRLTQSEAWTRH